MIKLCVGSGCDFGDSVEMLRSSCCFLVFCWLSKPGFVNSWSNIYLDRCHRNPWLGVKVAKLTMLPRWAGHTVSLLSVTVTGLWASVCSCIWKRVNSDDIRVCFQPSLVASCCVMGQGWLMGGTWPNWERENPSKNRKLGQSKSNWYQEQKCVLYPFQWSELSFSFHVNFIHIWSAWMKRRTLKKTSPVLP